MATSSDLTKRFSDFLSSPRELLDFEVKQWLDLNEENHRGLLAKAMIAMENHGGGYVLVGYKKGPPPVLDDAGRPADLSAYTSDWLTGILKRYAEPAFHVDVIPVVHRAMDSDTWQALRMLARARHRGRSTSTVGPPLRLGFNAREDRNAQIQRD